MTGSRSKIRGGIRRNARRLASRTRMNTTNDNRRLFTRNLNRGTRARSTTRQGVLSTLLHGDHVANLYVRVKLRTNGTGSRRRRRTTRQGGSTIFHHNVNTTLILFTRAFKRRNIRTCTNTRTRDSRRVLRQRNRKRDNRNAFARVKRRRQIRRIMGHLRRRKSRRKRTRLSRREISLRNTRGIFPHLNKENLKLLYFRIYSFFALK